MHRYTTKDGLFYEDKLSHIPYSQLHSINDNPALITKIGNKQWYFEGKIHRESGPAIILSNGNFGFYLNGKGYTFKHWCENNPNKTALVIYLLKN